MEIKMKNLTPIVLGDLQEKFTGEVYKAIEFVQNSIPKYPTKPRKPLLPSKHTSEDVLKYADQVKEYEKLFKEYEIESNKVVTFQSQVYPVLEEFLKDEAGLYQIVPKQYQNKVWGKAWEDGHSSGYYEVYNKLVNLIDIFDEN